MPEVPLVSTVGQVTVSTPVAEFQVYVQPLSEPAHTCIAIGSASEKVDCECVIVPSAKNVSSASPSVTFHEPTMALLGLQTTATVVTALAPIVPTPLLTAQVCSEDCVPTEML